MRAITNSFVLAALAVASTSTITSAKPSQEKSQKIERNAVDALRKMSVFLCRQSNFSVQTQMDTDYVLDNGQKVRRSSHGEVRVQRPAQLRAEVVSDRKDREFFYDGKTFTIFSPKIGYYATLPAPPTIGQLADQLQARYALELPLVDLFRWTSDESGFADIKEAHFVGATKLDGVMTDQYAFRQEGLDWQIWIEQGNRPLPHKMVLTTTDDKSRPEHSMDMTWQLNTAHAEDSLFTFVAPKDATKIAVAEIGAPQSDITRRAKRSARR